MTRIVNKENLSPGARKISRRAFLGSSAALACAASLHAQAAAPSPLPDTSSLRRAAQYSGKKLGMYTVGYDLIHDLEGAAIIANTFSLIADGNDLKFSSRLRPSATTYDFSYGDIALSWAEKHGLLFRGHCLVWWNALPSWFQSYVTTANARQVMTDHITTVVKHYAGRVYSWDVVNEAIYHDNRPDGLRRKPWIDLIGPEYIDLAFRTAYAADPKARLVLNECYVEHATPEEKTRRAVMLALATRLKKANVPITTIGLQSHLRGNTPLDKPGMTTFLKQVRDLGLEIMITEFDVDDVDVPGPMIEQVVAAKYAEYIEIVGPYVNFITFEDLRDNPVIPRRPDGLMHEPNLLDVQYRISPAYNATVKALMSLPRA